MSLIPYVLRDAQMGALHARAKLRALELETGRATDDDGRYWLARVTALEHVAAAARGVDDTAGSLARLQEAIRRLDGVQARVCREGDHQVPEAA